MKDLKQKQSLFDFGEQFCACVPDNKPTFCRQCTSCYMLVKELFFAASCCLGSDQMQQKFQIFYLTD